MTTLRRYDGTTTTYSNADMELLLAHLLSANSAGCSDGSVFFWTASPFLLIADLSFQVNRRLSELFEAQANLSEPFGISFSADGQYYSLGEALLACGYAGEVPSTEADLSSVYMALYQSPSGGADSKVLSDATGSSIVVTSGSQSLPAHLKGLLGGQGILLSESETDITISANATPIATIGAGLPLIDPSSTNLTKYLASLSVSNGLVLSRNAGVVSIGLGATLTLPGDTLAVPSGSQHKALSDSVAGITARVGTLEASDTAQGARITALETSSTGSASNVTALTTRVASLETSDTSQGTRITALETSKASASSVTALTTRVSTLETSDASQGTRITALEASTTDLGASKASASSVSALTTRVSTLETSATASASNVTALTNRVSTLETSDAAQNTRLTSLESGRATTASVTALTSRVSTLESSDATQATDIASIKTQISSLQTQSQGSSSTVLRYFKDDRAARIGNVPQFGLYRNGPTSFTMRMTADVAYAGQFNGGASYDTGFSQNSAYGWVLEWWAYIPRLFQQTMVSIVSPSKTISFGITGGGAYNCISGDGAFNFALASPEVNNWYLFGARMLYGTSTMTIYMVKQGTNSGNALQQVSASALQYSQALGSVALYVGRDPQNYSFQGQIVSPRFVDDTLYGSQALVLSSIAFNVSFPLLADPSGTVCLLDSSDGADPKNKVFPSAPVNKFGTPYMQSVNSAVQYFVP